MSISKVNRENNFIYLTLSLVVLLLSSALANTLPEGPITRWLFQGISLATLVVAYLSLDFGRFWRRFVAVLFALQILLNGLYASDTWAGADLVGLLLLMVFFLVAAAAAARQVLFPDRVDFNVVVGSIAIYLLMGLVWTVLYLFALEINPDALAGLTYEGWSNSFNRVLYFSYVTLATLGYGDISPQEPLTQVLASLQAITGTFYMAIVVASLISAHRWRRPDHEDTD